MREQSRVSASYVPLLVLWNIYQISAHPAQQVSMPVQPLLPLARGCAVVSVGQHQMQPWLERLWPNLRTQERLYLHAFAGKEYTVTLFALLNLACTVLTLLRCLLRDSLQREAALC